MSEVESQIRQIELSMQDAQKAVDKSDALMRLAENPDFKLLLEDEYMGAECTRLVLLKADGNMQDPDSQRNILADIDAIGRLRQFFIGINVMGDQARTAIADSQEAINELHETEE